MRSENQKGTVKEFEHTLLIEKVASRYLLAMEFPTEEAKKKYLEEHDVKPGTKLEVKEESGKGSEEKKKKELDITVNPAKYAKGMMLVQAPGTGGYKSRGGRLAEALKGKFSHRERCYIMSKTKAEKLNQLYADGWDAEYNGKLVPPGKMSV